jgi:hypothetical protein
MPQNWVKPLWDVTYPLMSKAMAVPGTTKAGEQRRADPAPPPSPTPPTTKRNNHHKAAQT